jgi:GNAT superfamily N-acetyltransferase
MTFELKLMQLEDLAGCLLLSEAEGWNQTEKDWNRILANPRNTCLVIVSEGRIIGTATAMNYSNELAWIGMVLVDKAFRGKGISKLLLSELLIRLASFKSVKLDATPSGQPIYEKYGFREECLIQRMTYEAFPQFQYESLGNSTDSILPVDLPSIIEFDAIIFGIDRSFLLNSLLSDYPQEAKIIKSNGKITAYALGRQGRLYHQIGPVYASKIEEAKF